MSDFENAFDALDHLAKCNVKIGVMVNTCEIPGMVRALQNEYHRVRKAPQMAKVIRRIAMRLQRLVCEKGDPLDRYFALGWKRPPSVQAVETVPSLN